jgi:hypothetical protein
LHFPLVWLWLELASGLQDTLASSLFSTTTLPDHSALLKMKSSAALLFV